MAALTHRVGIALSAAALLACSGATEPTPITPYPSVAGTYDFYARWDGQSTTDAHAAGPLTFVQADARQPVVTGHATIQYVVGGDTHVVTAVDSARVGRDSSVVFWLHPVGASQSWRFTGKFDGVSIVGAHILTASTGATLTGTFTATR